MEREERSRQADDQRLAVAAPAGYRSCGVGNRGRGKSPAGQGLERLKWVCLTVFS